MEGSFGSMRQRGQLAILYFSGTFLTGPIEEESGRSAESQNIRDGTMETEDAFTAPANLPVTTVSMTPSGYERSYFTFWALQASYSGGKALQSYLGT